jgi:regulator of nucleoside diphosphate kinase
MQNNKKRLILEKNEYNTIMSHLRNGMARLLNKKDAEELEVELQKARLFHEDKMLSDVVRLNSMVTIRNEATGKTMQLTLVLPGIADIKSKKISVLSPIGISLIGVQAGQTVSWRVPAGRSSFTIVEVKQTINQSKEVLS